MTTGNFLVTQLLNQEPVSKLASISNSDATKILEITFSIENQINSPFLLEISRGDRIVINAFFEESSLENDWWISYKVEVVKLNNYSTKYESAFAKNYRIDWREFYDLKEDTHVLQLGAFPMITSLGCIGFLISSRLLQAVDCLLFLGLLKVFLIRMS